MLDKAWKVRSDLVNYADPTDPKSTAYHPKIGAQFATPKDQIAGSYGGPSLSHVLSDPVDG